MTSLPPSLTLRDAQAVIDSLRLSFGAETGDVWRIDASSVTQLDTSALAVLLECARIAAHGGRKLEIVGAPCRLADLAQLYGVDGLLGVSVTPPPLAVPGITPVVPTPTPAPT